MGTYFIKYNLIVHKVKSRTAIRSNEYSEVIVAKNHAYAQLKILNKYTYPKNKDTKAKLKVVVDIKYIEPMDHPLPGWEYIIN